MNLVKSCLPKAAMAFLIFAVMTGVLYTGFITGIAQLFFPQTANGSVIEGNDGKRYSMLLGQTFTRDVYLWGRIQDFDFSVPSESPDNSNSDTIPNSHGKILMYSWPSNMSPAGDIEKESEENRTIFDSLMKQDVAERVENIREANRRNGITDMDDVPIPVDLVTNSGSGLDPHISPAAAEYQVPRIAAARGISEDEVRAVIKECTETKFLGVFGEEVVHVLKVNLMLDGILD